MDTKPLLEADHNESAPLKVFEISLGLSLVVAESCVSPTTNILGVVPGIRNYTGIQGQSVPVRLPILILPKSLCLLHGCVQPNRG